MRYAEPVNAMQAWELQLQAASVQGAVDLALSQEGIDDESRTIFENIGDRGIVGFVGTDILRQPRIFPGKDTGLSTIVFVDDNNPAVDRYPHMRRLPSYVDNLDATFLPVETMASTPLLASILLHEWVHRRDLGSDEHRAEADLVFPGGEAATLLSEIKAFEIEGGFLATVLGSDFKAYLDFEAEDADKRAIEGQEKNGGLLIEAGVDRSKSLEALANTVSILSPSAEQFLTEILAMAMPIHVGFRTIDRICDRNGTPDEKRLEMKMLLLGGNSEYLY